MVKFSDGGFDDFSFDQMTPETRMDFFLRHGPKFNQESFDFVKRHFSDDTQPSIAALSMSDEYKLPTVLTTSGDIVQFLYDPNTLRISRIRARPDAKDPAMVVQLVMSALLEEAGGDSSVIDPATIGFGETEKFARTYKGEWENAYKRYLQTKSLSANPFTSSSPASNLREMTARPSTLQTSPTAGYNAA